MFSKIAKTSQHDNIIGRHHVSGYIRVAIFHCHNYHSDITIPQNKCSSVHPWYPQGGVTLADFQQGMVPSEYMNTLLQTGAHTLFRQTRSR